jgi:hypothetical protein
MTVLLGAAGEIIQADDNRGLYLTKAGFLPTVAVSGPAQPVDPLRRD